MLNTKKISLIILTFCFQYSWGQNVIHNYDFSLFSSAPGQNCIDVFGAFHPISTWEINHWTSPIDTVSVSNSTGNSANFCHNCQVTWQVSPGGAKPGGYPYPNTARGLGYAQLSPRSSLFPWFNRSSINQKLALQLTQGEEYVVEFYTRPFKWTTYLTSNIGAYVTKDSITYYDYLKDLTPIAESSTVISDTSQWTRISSSFIATGNEQFITIGNFRHDTSSAFVLSNFPIDPLYEHKDAYRTQYLVDAIYLYKSSDTVYSVSLPHDTVLCPNETINLVAKLDSGFKLQDTVTTYLWNTGSTDSTLLVTAPGTYWVQTTINHRFVQSDTIVVSYFRDDYTLDLPDSVAICETELATISAATIPQTQYYWDNGHTGQTLYDVGTGTYILEAVTPCYTLQDTVKVYQQFCDTYIYIPNAFTPDGDGTNDFFAFEGVPEPVTLLVYDRWGGLVFKDTAYRNNWDGTSGGQDLPAGAYNYVIEYLYINPNATTATNGSTKTLTGTVRILR